MHQHAGASWRRRWHGGDVKQKPRVVAAMTVGGNHEPMFDDEPVLMVPIYALRLPGRHWYSSGDINNDIPTLIDGIIQPTRLNAA